MASKFTITAELNLQTKNLNQVIGNLRQQFQGANLNIKLKDLAQAQSHIQNISKSTNTAKKSFDSLGSSIVAAAKRFSGMALATGTLIGLTRAIKNAVGEAVEFEREIVKISQATGKTVSDLRSLSNEVGNVASQFGVSSKELILAARELTQAGFAADKVRGTLKLLAQTELAATFDSIADTTEGIIAVLNQFGRVAQRTGTEIDFLEKSLSAINQVSKDFAVESSDLITAIRTTGSAFESAGGSLDELLALFTSVRATTRESAESIATGFRTIFTRTQRLDTINNLRALGIELQDAEGKFIGPIKAVEKLSVALNTIDPRDFRFNLIVEELGGFRQVSKVIPLIQQFAVTQKALNVSQSASGSLAKDAATAQQSLGVQIEKTREEFKRFIRELVGSSSFQDTAKFLLSLANAFIKVADTIKPLIPLIASFAALKLGQAFVPGIKGLAGIGKKAQGGPIGFASGGLVPGSGNGDTVPAMLTPGEFVIKKSSVEKLGIENLAKANKYGIGGKARYNDIIKNIKGVKTANVTDKFSVTDKNKTGVLQAAPLQGKNPLLFGGAFLRPSTKGKISTQINQKLYGNVPVSGDFDMLDERTRQAIEEKTPRVKDANSGKLNFALEARSLSPAIGKKIDKHIKAYVIGAIDKSTQLLGLIDQQTASNADLGAIIKKSNIDSIVGNIFEAMLANAGAPFDAGASSSATFDFRNGLGNRASLFGDDALARIPTDAKSTYTTKNLQSFIKKAKNFIRDEIKVGKSKVEESKLSWSTMSPEDRVAAVNKGVAENKINSTVAGRLLSKGKGAGVAEAIRNLGLRKATGGSIAGLTEIPWMSKGGETDTVPAMLTPGEFVINKKSAQKIGSSALNRMNKVGKFAKGGSVGGIQHFAGGGSADDIEKYKKISAFLQQNQNAFSNKGLANFVKMIDEIVKDGRDLDKALDYLTNRINKAGGSIKFGKNTAAGLNQAAGPNSLEQQISKLNDLGKQYDDFAKSAENGNNNLILFGAAITSIVSQMSGLPKPIADAISAFSGTYTVVKGVGQNLKEFGVKMYAQSKQSQIAKQIEALHTAAISKDTVETKQHSAAVDRDTKSGKGGVGNLLGGMGGKGGKGGGKGGGALMALDIAIEAFSLAMAAAQAAAAYFAAHAELSAEKFAKSIDELTKHGAASTVSSQDLSKNLSEAFSSSAISKSFSEIFSLKTLKNIGQETVSKGSVNGGILSAAAKQRREAIDQEKAARTAGANLGTQAFENVGALKKGQKFLENPDLFKNEEVSGQANAMAASFVDATKTFQQEKDRIAKAYGGFENAPEHVKKGFEDLANQTDELERQFRQTSGILAQRVIKDLQKNISEGKPAENRALIDKAVKENAARETEVIKAKNEQNYANVAALGNNPNKKYAQMDLDRKVQAEAKQANAEYALSIEKANLQMQEQVKSMMIEKQAREAVIGSMQKQMAIMAGLENFGAKLTKIDSAVDALEATFSGTMTGLKSSIPDPKVLSALAPDTKDLQAALDKIASIGPEGQEIANNFMDVKKATQNLEIALKDAPAALSQSGKNFSVKDFVEKNVGISSSGEVGKQLTKMLEDTMKPKEGENATGAQKTSLVSKEAQENVLKQFKEFSEHLQKEGSGILENLAKAEAQQAGILQKINDSRQRQLEIVMKDIDSQQSLAENVAKARGKTLTLEQKNAFRYKKQFAMVGNLAGNAKGISAELAKVRDEMKKGGKADDQTAELANKAKNLQSALKDLSDQSHRTADVMTELEKLRAQRETARDFTKSYLFGTQEERQKTDETLQATQTAMMTGDIDSIPDELKSGVSSLLDQFKDIPAFNGMTGKQVQNQLMANKMAQMGNFEGAQMVLQDTSSPEEKLINELYSISASEGAAREGMMQEEKAMQSELNAKLSESRQATADLTAEIKALREKFQAQREQAGQGAPKPQDMAAVDKQIEEGKKKVEDLTKQVKDGEAEVQMLAKKFTDHMKLINEVAEAQKNQMDATATSVWLVVSAFKAFNPLVGILVDGFEALTGIDVNAWITKQVKSATEAAAGTGAVAAGGGGAQGKAMGGLIYRAGGGFAPKGTDTVPAMLTPGEFVVKKSAVDKIGVGALNQINAGHYAAGGQVDPNDPYYKMLGDVKRSKDKRTEELRALEGEGPITRTMQNRAQRGPGPMTMRAAMFNQNMRQNIISANQMRSQPMNLTMMRQQAMGRGGGAIATTPANQAAAAGPAMAAAAPGVGGAAGAPDMGGFAQSVESLNSIASTFSSFTETLSNLANQFAGITVQHTLTVDGSLAITGVDGNAIATQLSDAIKKQIQNEVEMKLGANNRQEKR